MNRRDAIALFALSAPALGESTTRSRLIGIWKLRSCVQTLKKGGTEFPFGQKPVGRIEYDKAGRMFALLMRPGRQSTVLPGKRLNEAPVEELRDAVTGFVAYFGTFNVDEATQTVTHHVEAAFAPNWVGTDLKRKFRFDGGRLVLTRVSPDGSQSEELIWDRETD
jgi:hypothetical protein